MAPIKCPSCGGMSITLFRCPKCGDLRCGKSTCKGSGGKMGAGGLNKTCHSCGGAKYETAR